MASCINKNSREYQRLKQISNIPEYQLEWQCRTFLDEHNRFPNLDELYGVNSEPYIKEQLALNNNICSTDKLFDLTKTQNVHDAIIALNNEYRDIQVQGIQIHDQVILDIKHKPAVNSQIKPAQYNQDLSNNFMVLSNLVETLSEQYGIPMEITSIRQIQEDPELRTLVDAQTSKAFIFNNTVYVNSDIASIDSPIHELLHIFIGSMRLSNPELYYSLIKSAEQFENYDQLIVPYKNRTQGDLDEEVFIHELAKYITKQSNAIQKLSPQIQYEILYNTTSTINSAFMGNYNASAISNPYNKSIKDLSRILDSNICELQSTSVLDNARASRQLANMKQQLFEKNELQEKCD